MQRSPLLFHIRESFDVVSEMVNGLETLPGPPPNHDPLPLTEFTMTRKILIAAFDGESAEAMYFFMIRSMQAFHKKPLPPNFAAWIERDEHVLARVGPVTQVPMHYIYVEPNEDEPFDPLSMSILLRRQFPDLINPERYRLLDFPSTFGGELT